MEQNKFPERPQARKDVVFRQLDDEQVLFDPTINKVHVLNMTAARVWSMLNGKMTQEEIAEAIQAAFDPAPSLDIVTADVKKAISLFGNKGLLT